MTAISSRWERWRTWPPARAGHGPRGLLLAMLSFSLLATGCASKLDPAPFAEFADATRKLGTGTEAVFDVDRTWSREVFVQRLVDGDVDSLELVATFPGDPDSFAVTLPVPPLFLVVERAARQMGMLDGLLVEYAELLVRLSGEEIGSGAELESLARRLNTDAEALFVTLSELGVEVPAAFEKRAPLVSTLAADAFERYLRERKRDALAAALRENHSTIEAWAHVARDALEGVRDDVQATFSARKRTLVRELTESSRTRRTRAAEDIADLLAELVRVMGALDELRLGYAAMARAHADLPRALETERPLLDALADFHARATRVAMLEASLREARVGGARIAPPAGGNADTHDGSDAR